MKNIAILLFVLLMSAGTYFVLSGSDGSASVSGAIKTANGSLNPGDSKSSGGSSVNRIDGKDLEAMQEDDSWEEYEDEQIQPATEVYSSASEALDAVKKGAGDYDDLILEQFVDIGDSCSWCKDFYSDVKRLMLEAKTDSDEQSYYAELLAISGSPDNVGTLLETLESADPEGIDFEVYADALEMTIGGDDVVKVLGEKLSVENEDLRESVVAAITNQGSAYAVDMLYKHTKENKIEDGYYAQGVGIGEIVPEEEAFPLLNEIVSERNEYSHLAVKSLLNSGVEGLKSVFQLLNDSNDTEFDNKLLEGAVDHVTYEQEVEDYLKSEVVKSNNEALKTFASKAIEMLKDEDQ